MFVQSRITIVSCLVCTVVAASDPAVIPVNRPPSGLPPLALPTAPETVVFPPGEPVSRPLQNAEPETPPTSEQPTEVQPTTFESLDRLEERRPLGRSWNELEYLLWWPSGQALPPLVTASRGGRPPILGEPQTQLLVGNDTLVNPDISGARFTHGFALDEPRTLGLSITYLFLGSRTVSATVSEYSLGSARTLGRPIIDAATGEEDVIPVSRPGSMVGAVDVSLSTRVTGWEITGLANLFTGPTVRLNALAGYRYFMANEGLRIDQLAFFPNGPGGPPVLVGIADQFDAHNRFHGGQFGLMLDWTRGPVFIEATGKVGLGQSVMVVRVSGQTVASALGPVPAVQWCAGGVLGQPTNSGRFERSGFAVLPEAGMRIGWRFQDRSRMYIGYNFLYLSEAVRAGEQIDRTGDESQVPLLGRTGTALAERPGPVLARSDFWVQGLVFGLEYRY
jgi:hypothetical protein